MTSTQQDRDVWEENEYNRSVAGAVADAISALQRARQALTDGAGIEVALKELESADAHVTRAYAAGVNWRCGT